MGQVMETLETPVGSYWFARMPATPAVAATRDLPESW
jgi:hypothetical protein